jgi:uncharacterized protein YcfL
MNHLFLILTTILLTACDSDKKIAENKGTIVVNTTSDKNTIIGQWTICKSTRGTGDSIVEITANVCTIVNFKYDNTAIVVYPSGDKESLKWNVNNNKVRLTNINPKSKETVYFNDGVYEMIFTPMKEYTELKLTLPDKNYSYYLGQ